MYKNALEDVQKDRFNGVLLKKILHKFSASQNDQAFNQNIIEFGK